MLTNFVQQFARYIQYNGKPIKITMPGAGTITMENVDQLSKRVVANPESKVSFDAAFSFGRDFKTTVSGCLVSRNQFVITIFDISVVIDPYDFDGAVAAKTFDRIVANIPKCEPEPEKAPSGMPRGVVGIV